MNALELRKIILKLDGWRDHIHLLGNPGKSEIQRIRGKLSLGLIRFLKPQFCYLDLR